MDGTSTSVWDSENPQLQTRWDSTSLRSFLACPYRYYLAHVKGWQTVGEKTHLEFGRIAGDGLETFYRGIIEENLDHEEALRRALRRVLDLSWDHERDTPLLGSYESVWHCSGERPFKNAKGNRAKCPWAHAGKYWAAPGPAVCGKCGSRIETLQKWVPEIKVKDRYQLVRLIVWYSEEVKNGYLKPVSFQAEPNSPVRALVEVPWTLPLFDHAGKRFFLCGWFDAVKSIGGEAYVTDYKTTGHTLGANFFAPFAPDIQVSVYDLAGDALFKSDIPFAGVAIEGIQTLVGGVRFDFRPFRKTRAQREELVRELKTWLSQATEYARTGYWPMNRASCHLCQFKEVCAAPEADRARILGAKFERSRWNPLLRQREEVQDVAVE